MIVAADVLGEDDDGGIECSFDYNQNILLASSEIFGALAIFPLIDKANLGIWGGRFGAFWITLFASVVGLLALGECSCSCLCFVRARARIWFGSNYCALLVYC